MSPYSKPPILLIVPSRARPHNARALLDVWQATTEGHSGIVFCLDDDDPTTPEYPRDDCEVIIGPRKRLAGWTNTVAVARLDDHALFGSIGDDHRPESQGWESAILDAVRLVDGPAIVYGDDGVHGEAIPTAFFVTSNIVRTVGGMGPPGVSHLFFDDWARELGRAAGCLRYLAGVKITHHHPLAGRAPMDQTYEDGGSNRVLWNADEVAFRAWMRDGLDGDAAKVRALRG